MTINIKTNICCYQQDTFPQKTIAPYKMEEADRVSQFGFSCIWNGLSGQNSSDGFVPPSPTTFFIFISNNIASCFCETISRKIPEKATYHTDRTISLKQHLNPMVLSGFSFSFSAFGLRSPYICFPPLISPPFSVWVHPFSSQFNEPLTRVLKHIIWSRTSANQHGYKKGFLGYKTIISAILKSNKWTISCITK